MKELDIQWCRNLINTLSLRGAWMVPRSGLIFHKTGEQELTLVSQMPFMPEMAEAAQDGRDVPATKEALEEYQQADFNVIARHFLAAGVVVKKQPKGT